MAGNITTPKLLGSTPDPYDGNPAKAQAFWNTLANYYTMNDTVYNTNDKKVPAALTNFKTGTCRGDWASDCIAEALAAQPTNYRMWAQFQTTFQKQFIPPEVQQEAIKGICHRLPCLPNFLLPIMFLFPLLSVTLGRFAHCLHTYLWMVLTFSRDLHMFLYASISFHSLLWSSPTF